MAITNTEETTRLNLPRDLPGIADGDYVEIVSCWSVGLRRRHAKRAIELAGVTSGVVANDTDPWVWKLALLAEIIKGWSDDAPVTVENIESMDTEVHDWICEQFQRLAEGRNEEESRNLDLPSSPGLDQDADNSPKALVTSSSAGG